MKRLLWVTAIEPSLDAGGGGQIRQAHLLAALAARFELHLLLAGALTDARVQALLESVTEVDAVLAADPPGRLRRRLRDLRWEVVQREPDEVARHAAIRRALAPRIASFGPLDVVCIEYIGLAPLLPSRRHARWALTLHNVPSEMARHNARLAPGRRQRVMREIEARNARRFEHWAASSYDLVVAVSREDAAILPGRVEVVPNGVDTDRLRPTPLPSDLRVVFTGALHTFPNRDGIEWFCRDVWPAVRASVPGAMLEIVGARPSAEVVALGGHDGVSVHADVPDIAPWLERARVAVVPLRIGSGSRLKALEAMAAGRPVAGTTIGLGGLELEPGRDALIADDPVALAAAIARCLTEDEIAGALASRGRELVEHRYSWARIAAGYAELLDRL